MGGRSLVEHKAAVAAAFTVLILVVCAPASAIEASLAIPLSSSSPSVPSTVPPPTAGTSSVDGPNLVGFDAAELCTKLYRSHLNALKYVSCMYPSAGFDDLSAEEKSGIDEDGEQGAICATHDENGTPTTCCFQPNEGMDTNGALARQVSARMGYRRSHMRKWRRERRRRERRRRQRRRRQRRRRQRRHRRRRRRHQPPVLPPAPPASATPSSSATPSMSPKSGLYPIVLDVPNVKLVCVPERVCEEESFPDFQQFKNFCSAQALDEGPVQEKCMKAWGVELCVVDGCYCEDDAIVCLSETDCSKPASEMASAVGVRNCCGKWNISRRQCWWRRRNKCCRRRRNRRCN